MSAAAEAPSPAPVRQPEPPYVVRLRMKTHSWTSPGMPRHDAEQLRDATTAHLVALGDGPGFHQFEGRDGKVFDVRAREVLAVELSREGHDLQSHRPTRGATGGTVPGSIGGGGVTLQVTGGLPADGTDYLRRRTGQALRETERAHR